MKRMIQKSLGATLAIVMLLSLGLNYGMQLFTVQRDMIRTVKKCSGRLKVFSGKSRMSLSRSG